MAPSIVDVLPPEVIGVIFFHCVHSNWNGLSTGVTKIPTLSTREAPLLLQQVCSRWRDISLSTPSLWYSVSVDFPSHLERVIPQLERWLLRARSLPLSLQIRYNWPQHPGTSSDGILLILRLHSTQLHELSLNIPPQDYNRLREVVGPLPNLAKLKLYTLQHPIYQAQPVSAFSDTATLRDVHIAAGFDPDNLLLPWGQLSIFRADTMHMWHCLKVLSLASNLAACTMKYHQGRPRQHHISVPPLLQLTKLVLTPIGVSLVPVSDFLARLTTPALVHLEADVLRFDIWAAFLARSGCMLEHLTMEPIKWTSSDYERYLGCLTTLTELRLRRSGVSFYNILAPLKNSPNFLPRLKSLEEVHWSREWLERRASLEEVLDMLEMRRLQKFKLLSTIGLAGSKELLERLTALKKNGMKIDIEGSMNWGL